MQNSLTNLPVLVQAALDVRSTRTATPFAFAGNELPKRDHHFYIGQFLHLDAAGLLLDSPDPASSAVMVLGTAQVGHSVCFSGAAGQLYFSGYRIYDPELIFQPRLPVVVEVRYVSYDMYDVRFSYADGEAVNGVWKNPDPFVLPAPGQTVAELHANGWNLIPSDNSSS